MGIAYHHTYVLANLALCNCLYYMLNIVKPWDSSSGDGALHVWGSPPLHTLNV